MVKRFVWLRAVRLEYLKDISDWPVDCTNAKREPEGEPMQTWDTKKHL
jgi:hypothetical protein